MNTLAKKKKFSYIVKGTRRKTATWHIDIEGKSIVQKSTVPVLVIPENLKYKPISKIAYSMNLSENESFLTKESLILLKRKRHMSHVTILFNAPNTTNSIWNINELKKIAEKSNYKQVVFEELITKNTKETIINYAEENEIDILALNNLYIFCRNIRSD